MAVFLPLEPGNKQERTNGIKSTKKYYAPNCCKFDYRNHAERYAGVWVNSFWGFQVAHARYHDYALSLHKFWWISSPPLPELKTGRFF